MTDIPDRLVRLAQQLEDQHAPQNMTILMREAAAEIERLRSGGCARDQGTTQYCAEAAEKDAHIRRMALEYLQDTGQLSDEVARLRAALEMFACDCEGKELCAVPGNCRNHIARAALAQPKGEKE